MNRLQLHREWLEETISVRMRCKSYLNPLGRKELDDLTADLERTINQLEQINQK